jgi:hypothetical protein
MGSKVDTNVFFTFEIPACMNMNISKDVDVDMNIDMKTDMNMEMDTGTDINAHWERTWNIGIWGVKTL